MNSGGHQHADRRLKARDRNESLLLARFETALLGRAEAGRDGTLRPAGVYDLGRCFEILTSDGVAVDEAGDWLLLHVIGRSGARTEGAG